MVSSLVPVVVFTHYGRPSPHAKGSLVLTSFARSCGACLFSACHEQVTGWAGRVCAPAGCSLARQPAVNDDQCAVCVGQDGAVLAGRDSFPWEEPFQPGPRVPGRKRSRCCHREASLCPHLGMSHFTEATCLPGSSPGPGEEQPSSPRMDDGFPRTPCSHVQILVNSPWTPAVGREFCGSRLVLLRKHTAFPDRLLETQEAFSGLLVSEAAASIRLTPSLQGSIRDTLHAAKPKSQVIF